MPGRFPLPREAPNAHDYLLVGVKGGAAPGIVRSIDVKRAHDIDIKKASGSDGATPTTNGEKPVDVDIVLELWDDPSDPERSAWWIEYLTYFLDSLFPEGRAPTPRDVGHPKLALHRIKSLFFCEWDGPKELGYAHWQVALKAANYKPPPKVPRSATSTPKTSTPVTPGNVLAPPKPTGAPAPKVWTPPRTPNDGRPKP